VLAFNSRTDYNSIKGGLHPHYADGAVV